MRKFLNLSVLLLVVSFLMTGCFKSLGASYRSSQDHQCQCCDQKHDDYENQDQHRRHAY